MAEIRIRINENIKLHARLVNEFAKYTVHERNEMIINALAEYFLYNNPATIHTVCADETTVRAVGQASSNEELIQLIKQIASRLDDVEQAVAGQAHQKAEGSDAVSYINSESCPETENRSEIKHEEDRHVPEKTHSHESARREEVQDISEPDIPPAVLSMIEMLQNG